MPSDKFADQTVQAPPTPLTLEQEFLQLTGSTIRRNPLPVFFGYCLIAFAAWGTVPIIWIASWLAVGAIGLFGRAALLSWALSNPGWTDTRRLRLIYGLNLNNGLIACLSLAFFPYVSVIDAALIMIVLSGLAIGVLVSNAGVPKATYPYTVLVLLGMAGMWILFPHAEGTDVLKAYVVSAFMLIMVPAIIGISKDIYRLFRNAVDMRQKYADINAQLTEALRESQAANAAKTRFLAAASHDLRQPVHTLSLLTAALISRNARSNNADERINEITLTMDNSLQSLARQLDSLLDISKLDAGIITPNCAETDLTKIINALVNEFLPVAQEKRLTLKADVDDSLYSHTDGTLLERLLRNILANAVKYTDKGEIEITGQITGDEVAISVKDTGIGIDQDQQKLVFEEFYQINNPHRDRNKGLGLGLSIVQRLCRLLAIQLQLQSALGKGSEFILTLKASKDINAMDTLKQIQSSFKHRQVLVIDDEADIRLATRAYLEALDCEVLLADGGEQALKLVQNKRPDLVIVDLRLRDHENGIDTLEKIRRLHPDLPAILVTGDTAPDRLREAAQAKAKLLHKPIYSDQLQLAMEEVLYEKAG